MTDHAVGIQLTVTVNEAYLRLRVFVYSYCFVRMLVTNKHNIVFSWESVDKAHPWLAQECLTLV